MSYLSRYILILILFLRIGFVFFYGKVDIFIVDIYFSILGYRKEVREFFLYLLVFKCF